jgi:hypothetical protein
MKALYNKLSVPSYMAFMLNVAVFIDGYPLIPHVFCKFKPYNQSVDTSRAATLLWHGSCAVTATESKNKIQGDIIHHREFHRSARIGWLRAAVLGANDGTISVASLVVGVAVAGASRGTILLTGVAGLLAGAMSMAAGEYVSVQSQADTEEADIKTEKHELELDPEREVAELTALYASRGLVKS